MAKLTRKQINEGLDQIPLDSLLLGARTETRLTPKQREFARKVANGTGQTQAYRETYNTQGKSRTQSIEAHKTAHNPKVASTIEAFRRAKEFSEQHTAAQLRALVIQKLTEHATSEDNSPRDQLQALKLLGTVAEVGAFAVGTGRHLHVETGSSGNIGGTLNWDDAVNWFSNPTIGDGAGNTVDFTQGDVISAGETVNMATSRTIGTFNVGDKNSSWGMYTFSTANGSTLTFDTGDATTAQLNGTATGGAAASFAVPIVINSNLNVSTLGSGSIGLSGGITSTGTKNITLNANGTSGGTIALTGVNNTGTILNSGSGTGATTISGIGGNVTGVTQNSATSSMTLSGDNSAFGGTINLTTGSLILNGATSLGTATLNIAAGTTLSASASTVIASFAPQNWNGNFTLGGSSALNLGAGAIALGTNVLVSHSATGAITFGGAVAGTANLAIDSAAGAGSFTFSGAISHTGDISTTRNSTGTTEFSNIVNNVGNITFAANGTTGRTLYSGFVNNTGTISDSGTSTNSNFQFSGGIGNNVTTITHTYAGTMTLGTGVINNSGLIANTGGSLVISGNLGSTVTGVTQNSAGSTVLTGTNINFTGPFTIISGTLGGSISNNASINAFNKNHVVAISTGGIFDVSNNSLTIAGLNDGTNGGGAVINSTNNGSSKALTVGGSGTYSFSGSLLLSTGTNPSQLGLTVALTGAGKQTLSGVNTYTSGTSVNLGTLEFKSGASNLSQALGTLAFAGADGTLKSNKSGAGALSTTFTTLAARSAGNTGNVVSTGGTNGTDNNINLTQAAGFINAGLYFNGADFAAMNATNTYVRALNYATTGGDPNTVDVNTITGSKHVKLTSTPGSSQGTTTLLTLNLAGSGVSWTSSAATLTAPGVIKSGGGLQSTISGGSLRSGSNVELVIRTDTASDLLAISSNLTQGSGVLTKSGAGTLSLSGTNTFTGQTYVNGGTLSIGANVNLGAEATGATLNLRGGTLQATGTFGLFNGTAGTNNRTVVLSSTAGIDVTNGNALTVAGVVSGAGSLTKMNSGTLVLGGTNTYTGTTTVDEGTLLVNGSLSGSAVVVAGGGTLGGNGTISGSSTAIQSGGIHAPGNSPAIQTFDNDDLTYNTGSTFQFELFSNTDTLGDRGNVTVGYDGVNLTGTSVLSIQTGVTAQLVFDGTTDFTQGFWSGSHSWLVFDNNNTFTPGSGSIFDSISIVNNATGTAPVVSMFSFSQSGNDIYLNYAIPEPSSFLLLTGGLLGLAALRRRQKK